MHPIFAPEFAPKNLLILGLKSSNLNLSFQRLTQHDTNFRQKYKKRSKYYEYRKEFFFAPEPSWMYSYRKTVPLIFYFSWINIFKSNSISSRLNWVGMFSTIPYPKWLTLIKTRLWALFKYFFGLFFPRGLFKLEWPW